MELLRTPLYEEHLRLGGRIVPFHDWEMPIQYSGIIEEHLAVRNAVGIFDVSHMGEIEIHGRDTVQFVDYLVTNSVAPMKQGRVKYTPMCYPNGGEVDDLFIYKIAEDFILLVVNASNYKKDLSWAIENKGTFDVEILGKTFDYGEVAIQGPLSESLLKNYFVGNIPLASLGYFQSIYGKLFGINVLVSRTGYTGEDGFEVYADKDSVINIWRETIDKGKVYGIKPAGLGARDTLRFEVSYWLYGNDIDETTNPFEAGQGFAVKLEKERFIGKEALLKINQQGTTRKLTGLYIPQGGIPRQGMEVFSGSSKVGYITSGNFCPYLNKIYAMAYIDNGYNKSGTELSINLRGKETKGIVVDLPFLEPRSGKKNK